MTMWTGKRQSGGRQALLAMAMVNMGLCAEGTKLSVHVVGVEQIAKVMAPSPYDPAGAAMRV